MVTLKSRHCERSEAIQRADKGGLLRRHSAPKTRVNALMAPRNDGANAAAKNLYAVLTRMAQLRNASATCDLTDCRRARRCVGLERRCAWNLPDRPFWLARDDVPEWRDLMRARRQCLDAIKVAAIKAR